MMFAVVSAFLTLSLFSASAQSSTCRVEGLDGVVATVTPLVKAGNGSVSVTVSLNKNAEDDTSIAVEVYDNQTLVASGMAKITAHNSFTSVTIKGDYIQSGKMYSVKIASASCKSSAVQFPVK